MILCRGEPRGQTLFWVFASGIQGALIVLESFLVSHLAITTMNSDENPPQAGKRDKGRKGVRGAERGQEPLDNCQAMSQTGRNQDVPLPDPPSRRSGRAWSLAP